VIHGSIQAHILFWSERKNDYWHLKPLSMADFYRATTAAFISVTNYTETFGTKEDKEFNRRRSLKNQRFRRGGL